MALLDDFLFLVVLAVPGFVVVSTGRYLAGVSESSYTVEYTRAVLLWSVVANAGVGVLLSPTVTGLETIRQELFTLNPEVLVPWLALPLVLGVVYAMGLIVRLPHVLQRNIQRLIRSRVPSKTAEYLNTTDSPWKNFFRLHKYVAVSTSARDEEGREVERVYSGQVIEWSSSKRDRELRLYQPYVHIDGERVPVYASPDAKGVADESSELLVFESNITKVAAVPPVYYPDVANDDVASKGRFGLLRLLRKVVTGTEEGQERADSDEYPSQARFDLYRDDDERWRWRLRHRNGTIIAESGRGYASRRNATRGIESVRRNSSRAPVRPRE